MSGLEFAITFLVGTFWSFVFGVLAILIVMYLVDQFGVSPWWILGGSAISIALMMLIPHGYHLMQITFSDRPPFSLIAEGLSQDRLSTLVEYRFWGGLVGCVVGFVGWTHFFGSRR